MALPVVASTNTATADGASSIVVTFPSGLASGDEMCINIGYYDNTSGRTASTPGGWTSRQNQTSGLGAKSGLACFTKTATAGDVSAGSVTVSMNGSTSYIRASIARITGAVPATPIVGSEVDTGTGFSYTTALTPVTNDSLMIASFTGAMTSGGAGSTTAGSYSSTPSATWTEIAEMHGGSAGNENMGFACAYAPYTGSTQWTNRSVTFSQSFSYAGIGIAIMYEGTQDATGSNTLLSVSPSFFTPAGRADTNGTNALLSVSPELFSQSGRVTGETAWTNPDKPSTTWNNLDK